MMGNIIVFLIIAIVTVVKAVSNYNKEKAKNKDRVVKPPLRNTQQAPPPFSRNMQTAPVILQPTVNESTQTQVVVIEESVVEAHLNKYQSVNEYVIEEPAMEGKSSLSETLAFASSEDQNSNNQNSSFDLELDTPQDYRRAFVHSLIFERKY